MFVCLGRVTNQWASDRVKYKSSLFCFLFLLVEKFGLHKNKKVVKG